MACRIAALGLIAALLALPAAAGGLFATAGNLDAARARPAALAAFLDRADVAAAQAPAPFVARDMAALRFGWREREAPAGTTLAQAVAALEADSDRMRTLALAFALTGETRYAEVAERFLADWAARHTVVNFYDFNPDFVLATHDGATQGFDSDRPWNFGLDSMWQSYGLANAADALMLLDHGGWQLADRGAVEDWLRRLAAGVNAGLHAWTRVADAGEVATSQAGHGPALREGVRRHRSDNHLSWALVGLLGAAAALGDEGMAAYVLDGASWDDGRSGPYANPSTPAALIDAVIEGPPETGRIFEEAIGRQPPITYALFHLEALTLIARIAELHFRRDLWALRGADGAGLADAYHRYAPILAATLDPGLPGQHWPVTGHWLAALTPESFEPMSRAALLAVRALPGDMRHAIGPAQLLFDEGE